MPYYMYVALQDDNKISVHSVDPQTGKLTPQGETAVPGGPFTPAGEYNQEISRNNEIT